MPTLAHDLRYACRLLVRAPGFTAVAATVLALGAALARGLTALLFGVQPLDPLTFLLSAALLASVAIAAAAVPAFRAARVDPVIGIGAAVTRRPLPHHRAYGSVHGGSRRLRAPPDSNSAVNSWPLPIRTCCPDPPTTLTLAHGYAFALSAASAPWCGSKFYSRVTARCRCWWTPHDACSQLARQRCLPGRTRRHLARKQNPLKAGFRPAV